MKRLPLVAALAALVLTACGSTASDDGDDAKGWSYKSGDGKTYTAEKTPTRIIAQGEAAAALMSFGIKPKAVFLNDNLENVTALKGVDMSGIEIIGETWGEIDAEKAAAIRPDLIVTTYWPVSVSSETVNSGSPMRVASGEAVMVAVSNAAVPLIVTVS